HRQLRSPAGRWAPPRRNRNGVGRAGRGGRRQGPDHHRLRLPARRRGSRPLRFSDEAGPAGRAGRGDRARSRRQAPARPRRQEIEEPHSPLRSIGFTQKRHWPLLALPCILRARPRRPKEHGGWTPMNLLARALALTGILLGGVTAGGAFAQKPGGTLKVYFFDSPGSMSIHEESTIAGQGPAQGVFNNLVMYDQHIAQTSIKTIVPDLASEWAWDEANTQLTFKLRDGVN